MRKKNIIIVIMFCFVCVNSYSYPKQEIRAAWLTTIGGLDWPHSYAHDGYGIENQQRELCEILDKYVDAGFNTILFQTRVRGTVAYPSSIEPWETAFSGEPRMSPGYDVLDFAIRECHKRGLKLHAWVVAIPLGKWDGPGCVALRKTSPSLLKKIKDEGFMNPEKRETSEYIARLCNEIVSRYDVDGIHLDYIRYPETWGKVTDTKQARNNITRIVRAVHKSVKNVKPWVAISCSPVGKYADTKRAWARGWNAKNAVHQDAALWLKEGLLDIIFPMMYFKDKDFYPFAIDWYERANGRIVVPGLGIYFMHPDEKNWPLCDITREMMVCRQYNMGTCFFRSKFFTDNTKNLYDYTRTVYSPYLSIQPSMSWLSNIAPPSPLNLCITENTYGNKVLTWDAPLAINDIKYNVYGSAEYNVDIENAENLLMIEYAGSTVDLPLLNNIKYFAVTSVDRYGNESSPAYLCNTKNECNNTNKDSILLKNDNNFLYLDECDVTFHQVIELHSLEGNALTSRFVRSYKGNTVIDISGIKAGYYKVFVINKKGYRHLLGRLYKHI